MGRRGAGVNRRQGPGAGAGAGSPGEPAALSEQDRALLATPLGSEVWRWLREREDCPWYPSARLFRQRSPRDWDEVFAEVAAELTKLAAPHAARVP